MYNKNVFRHFGCIQQPSSGKVKGKIYMKAKIETKTLIKILKLVSFFLFCNSQMQILLGE